MVNTVIGTGMIASAFLASNLKQKTCVFASGVSDSKESNWSAFYREDRLLTHTLGTTKCDYFIYFSSTSVNHGEPSPYRRHKLNMEAKTLTSPGGTVFRLPQVVGFSRENNMLVNYFYRKITRNEEIHVMRDATRALIALSDVVRICEKISHVWERKKSFRHFTRTASSSR